jgi:hypothetical protein
VLPEWTFLDIVDETDRREIHVRLTLPFHD